MIQFVRKNVVVTTDQRSDYAEVRHITGREQQRAGQLHELRERCFEPVMRGRVTENQVGRSGADAVGARAITGRGNQAWISRKPEIIVAAKRHIVMTIHGYSRALR